METKLEQENKQTNKVGSSVFSFLALANLFVFKIRNKIFQRFYQSLICKVTFWKQCGPVEGVKKERCVMAVVLLDCYRNIKYTIPPGSTGFEFRAEGMEMMK